MPRSDYTEEQLRERERRAFRDFDLISSGYTPKESELQGAPHLEDWLVEVLDVGVFCLVGSVSGHPSIDDGLMSTSVVIGWDANAGWCRTASRWYSLGAPARLTPSTPSNLDTGLSEEFPEDDGGPKL